MSFLVEGSITKTVEQIVIDFDLLIMYKTKVLISSNNWIAFKAIEFQQETGSIKAKSIATLMS